VRKEKNAFSAKMRHEAVRLWSAVDERGVQTARYSSSAPASFIRRSALMPRCHATTDTRAALCDGWRERAQAWRGAQQRAVAKSDSSSTFSDTDINAH